MAIDVSILGSPEAFDQRLDELIQEIHAAPRADDCDRVYLPGEREWERLDTSLAAGIPLPSDVMEKLLLVRDATDTHSPFMN
jgi:LDH2 family malate/lactate/ureidoglycolate dehydrogenase